MGDIAANEIRRSLDREKIAERLGPGKSFSFRCTACGNCCRQPGIVYFTASELKKIYSYLGLSRMQKRELQQQLIQREHNGYLLHDTSGACLFLGSDNRCRIYPFRPLQCRSFPFWPTIFSSASALDQVKKECPGISQENGLQFRPRQIAKRVRQVYRKFLKPQGKRDSYLMI